jgi:hypothetical protein
MNLIYLCNLKLIGNDFTHIQKLYYNTLTLLHMVGTTYIETEQAEAVRAVLFLNIAKLLS